MKRALLIVLDSVGIGHAPDAADFGDAGANTMGHIRQHDPGFSIPTLDRSGLHHAERLAAGEDPLPAETAMAWGALTQRSAGKDTTTGHWEIAGAVTDKPFSVFASFPAPLVAELEAAAGTRFIGNYARSGTVILEELGEEHLRTGHPILYTSSDSVLQIAAHEDLFPLERLFAICRACRPIADRERIGRVIARPFAGRPGSFHRTSNRRDFSLPPPPTVLDALEANGVTTVGIGKIADIFAGQGIRQSHPTKGNDEGMLRIAALWEAPPREPVLFFANLVDFDMLYGHRRDVGGYARALEAFDRWLNDFLPRVEAGDLLIITADHGNDPTWIGTDHTRERTPLLLRAEGIRGCLGIRESFADVAATLAAYFGLPPWNRGQAVGPRQDDGDRRTSKETKS